MAPCGVALDAVPNLMVEYINKGFKTMRSRKYFSRHGASHFLSLLAVAVLMDCFNAVDSKQKLPSWRGPNSFIMGIPPAPRDCHGFATVLGNLYVFGGNSGGEGTNLKYLNKNLDFVSTSACTFR